RVRLPYINTSSIIRPSHISLSSILSYQFISSLNLSLIFIPLLTHLHSSNHVIFLMNNIKIYFVGSFFQSKHRLISMHYQQKVDF
ncbi:ATP-dependent rRNA helicase rrp3, partial [Bienertia sinuspersici]